MNKTAVLVVAAGHGRRFGDPVPKQYHLLGEKQVLTYCLKTFVEHPAVDIVQVVLHPDWRFAYDAASSGLSLLDPVEGGASRQESVRLGLEALCPHQPEKVLIHDAARPGVTNQVIDGVLAALESVEGALPALPVADTLKRGDAAGRIGETVSRENLWRAQTPQGFSFSALLAAHRRFSGEELTDDAALAEAAGMKVVLTPGDWRNDKITQAEDLERAAAWVGNGVPSRPEWEYRTGIGYDVHRFAPGDQCWLCGIAVPHTASLKGHSDADVGLHALTDAVLGAVGDGDIGTHFPPSDDRWRGASSDRFLEHAVNRVVGRGGAITHLDVTLICERPKIGPHKAVMAERISQICGIDPGRVSVKATTTEKLGFTGREEGIAAQAVATVRLPSQP